MPNPVREEYTNFSTLDLNNTKARSKTSQKETVPAWLAYQWEHLYGIPSGGYDEDGIPLFSLEFINSLTTLQLPPISLKTKNNRKRKISIYSPSLKKNVRVDLDIYQLAYDEWEDSGQDEEFDVVNGSSYGGKKNKQSAADKFQNGFLGQNAEAIIGGLDVVGNITNSLPGAGNTYNGIKGDTRKAIDEGYNAIADAAAKFGPYGQMASMAMKGANLLNGLLGAIFGATDGMTTTDAIMDSPLGFLTGVGWINQAFGLKSDTITKNLEAFALVGSSYGGSNAAVDNALTFSGKKYGAFSSGARKDANTLISEARRQQNLIEDISNEAVDRNNLVAGMSSILGNRRSLALLGGYDLSAIRVGRLGLSLKTILTAKRIVSTLKYLRGGKTKGSFDTYLQSLPETLCDSTNFRIKNCLEFNEKSQNFDEVDLKPTCIINEITLDSILPEFKEGGKVNVIPEGALHSRLHHMENADNLTKKGIPVVVEKEEGELEQQAEIERDEVILRLEVTKKLEELQKKYTDELYSLLDKDSFAIEAGKLLVYELLENTVDNTGLLSI